METMDEIIPEPTKEESSSIKAIGKDTVHKICSGQVKQKLQCFTGIKAIPISCVGCSEFGSSSKGIG